MAQLPSLVSAGAYICIYVIIYIIYMYTCTNTYMHTVHTYVQYIHTLHTHTYIYYYYIYTHPTHIHTHTHNTHTHTHTHIHTHTHTHTHTIIEICVDVVHSSYTNWRSSIAGTETHAYLQNDVISVRMSSPKGKDENNLGS